jgi:hypothetical protein
MRRLFLGAASLGLGLVLVAPRAEAQFFVSASATIPSGDYGDYAKTGWLAGVGARAWANEAGNIALWLVGEYGSNSHDADVVGVTDGDKTNIMSGGAFVAYTLGSNPDASMTPFIVAGGGYMNHQWSPATGDSENSGQAFAGGGLGLSFGDESGGPWILATYRNGFDDTKFITIGGGWTF